MTKRCIAYGDCNTEGLQDYHVPLWPELVAAHFGFELVNCAHTMSTTRELRRYAKAFPPGGYDLVLIQYGLVDSWQVFRGAPYVLYYPDNPLRKIARKLVKKFKKLGRRWHLLERLGAVEQVPLPEYLDNIVTVVGAAPGTRVVLVATPPNLDESRNPRIQAYNRALHTLVSQTPNAVVADAYPLLWQRRAECLMADGTHLTAQGHEVMAGQVIAELEDTPATVADRTVPSP